MIPAITPSAQQAQHQAAARANGSTGSISGLPAAEFTGPRMVIEDIDSLRRPNGERYLPRELGGHHDVAVIRALAKSSLFVLLAGEPGAGKTALAEASFPDLISVQCHGDMTVAHLLGTHLPTESGGWRWSDGPLVQAMKTGRSLYLDEVNAIPADVSTVLHSAMDGRGVVRIDDRPDTPDVHVQPGFYVIGSYNPGSLGGRRLPEALTSRFSVQVTVSTDYDAARTLGVPEELVTIAENLAVKAASDRARGGRGVWVPQMRELLVARRLIQTGFTLGFAAAAVLAQCPWPEDQDVVREVSEHVLGLRLQDLHLGPQAW